jgi:hypothetical protein
MKKEQNACLSEERVSGILYFVLGTRYQVRSTKLTMPEIH